MKQVRMWQNLIILMEMIILLITVILICGGDSAAAASQLKAAAPAATQVSAPAHRRAVRADERRAIAVLPLPNMSGDPENEFFSDGITEELLNLLARQPGLRVVSRTSSFSFKNTTLDIPTIADRLGVDIVLDNGFGQHLWPHVGFYGEDPANPRHPDLNRQLYDAGQLDAQENPPDWPPPGTPGAPTCTCETVSVPTSPENVMLKLNTLVLSSSEKLPEPSAGLTTPGQVVSWASLMVVT